MFSFIGMQFRGIFCECTADDPRAFVVTARNGMNSQSDLFFSHGMTVDLWECASDEEHAERAALHESRGPPQHHPERFIPRAGCQNQMFGEDAIATGQNFKAPTHPGSLYQSVVTACVVLLAEMVQHNPRINYGFFEVVHLVVSVHLRAVVASSTVLPVP